jgi:hypothetical protein
MEGTWALPDTPKAAKKMQDLLGKPLIVGPDATNATEQLYDLVGDDHLFDILYDIADKNPDANCWEDSRVIERLIALGIPADQAQAKVDTELDTQAAPAHQ